MIWHVYKVWSNLIPRLVRAVVTEPILRAFDIQPDSPRPLRLAVCVQMCNKLAHLSICRLVAGGTWEDVHIFHSNASVVCVDDWSANLRVYRASRLIPSGNDKRISSWLQTWSVTCCDRGANVHAVCGCCSSNNAALKVRCSDTIASVSYSAFWRAEVNLHASSTYTCRRWTNRFRATLNIRASLNSSRNSFKRNSKIKPGIYLM